MFVLDMQQLVTKKRILYSLINTDCNMFTIYFLKVSSHMTAWGVYAHQKSKYSAICMMAFMIFLTFVISFKLVSNSYSINHLIQLI